MQLVPRAVREVDRPRRDGVDADALRRQHVPEAGRVLQNRGLERGVGVGRRRRQRVEGRRRAERDDRGRVGLFEVGHRCLDEPHERQQVGLEARLPLVRPLQRAGRDVGDHDVEPGEFARRRLDELSDRLLVGHVHSSGDDLESPRAKVVRKGLQRLDAARAQREVASLGGELLGDGASDSAAGAGHQGLAAGQLQIHSCFLSRGYGFGAGAARSVAHARASSLLTHARALPRSRRKVGSANVGAPSPGCR